MSGKTEKTQKKSWFKGLQAEFKKVIWPDKNALVKQRQNGMWFIPIPGMRTR